MEKNVQPLAEINGDVLQMRHLCFHYRKRFDRFWYVSGKEPELDKQWQNFIRNGKKMTDDD